MKTRVEKLLDNRSVTHFNISIATGFGLAALFDANSEEYTPTTDKPNVIERYDSKLVDLVYINIDTMIRNIITSVDDKKYILTNDSIKAITNTLKEEVLIINSLFESIDLKVIFFVPDYNKLFKTFIRKERRPIPSQKDLIEDITTAIRGPFIKSKLNVNILSDTYLLPKSKERVIIMSHYTHDLLNYVRIPKLKLLESHTGIVMDNLLFNRKYAKTGQVDFTRFPFNEFFLRIVGDKAGLFKPDNIKIRYALHELGEKKQWNPSISNLRLKEELKSLPDLQNRLINYKALYK